MSSASAGPRHTARGIVVRGDQLLLMERWRPGLHYFSIPGGGIEPDETPEQTVAREIAEETSVSVTVGRQVLEMRDGDVRHLIYLCRYNGGEPLLPADAPERRHDPDQNRFQPQWVPITSLPNIPYTYWQAVKNALINGLAYGFDDEVVIVSAAPSR